MGRSSSSLQQSCQSSRTFVIFDNIVPIFDPFRKHTSIKKTIGSGLKCVATGSVSKRYQTNLFAQGVKTSLENLNFDVFHPIFSIRKPPTKITRYGETFQRKMFRATSWIRKV